jgi:hypothetical protein
MKLQESLESKCRHCRHDRHWISHGKPRRSAFGSANRRKIRNFSVCHRTLPRWTSTSTGPLSRRFVSRRSAPHVGWALAAALARPMRSGRGRYRRSSSFAFGCTSSMAGTPASGNFARRDGRCRAVRLPSPSRRQAAPRHGEVAANLTPGRCRNGPPGRPD